MPSLVPLVGTKKHEPEYMQENLKHLRGKL